MTSEGQVAVVARAIRATLEGDSSVVWFEGGYADYEADYHRRRGTDAAGTSTMCCASAFSAMGKSAARKSRAVA